MKKIKKVYIILFIVSIFANLLLINQSNAITTNLSELEPIYQIADLNPGTYQPSGGTVDSDFVNKYTGRLTSVLFVVAVIVAIITIMIIGIKYIVGSVQEKADYKKNLMPVLIGILIISFLTAIIAGIANLATSVESTQQPDEEFIGPIQE